MGPFATATEFCEFTGMALPSDLARLQAIIDDASAEIRGFTGQVLERVTNEQVTFPSWQSALIVLPERPVVSISSVLVDGVSQATTVYESRGAHLWKLDGTAWGATTVTYTHGYAETSPEFQRIKTICIQAAARAFTLNSGSTSERMVGTSTALGSTLMETAGYAPEVFLTPGEQSRLSDYTAAVFA